VATNLELDDKLIESARKLGGHKTKRETQNCVTADNGLIEKVDATLNAFSLKGSVAFDSLRHRRRVADTQAQTSRNALFAVTARWRRMLSICFSNLFIA